MRATIIIPDAEERKKMAGAIVKEKGVECGRICGGYCIGICSGQCSCTRCCMLRTLQMLHQD